MSVAAGTDRRSIAELTRAVFGEELTLDQVFERVADNDVDRRPTAAPVGAAPRATVWVGSAGYERYKDNREFARTLSAAGVERLIDVRELPISRRRGYAKTALGAAMDEVGIEYVHMKELGNPKPFRDLYKSGRTAEGRAAYEAFLLAERREALEDLATTLTQRRAALMCVEHDAKTCHRAVIVEALERELGLDLHVCHVA